MRQGLHIITALLSCCFLCFNTGCQSEEKVRDNLESNAKTDDKKPVSITIDAEDNNKEGNEIVAQPVVAEPVAPVIGGDPVPPPIPNSIIGGGGSQGALKPSRTGNEDEIVIEPRGPDGKCGDGQQNVLPDSKFCHFRLYGTSTSGSSNPSNLYGFHLHEHGKGVLIGQIGPNIDSVTAIDFAPDGHLYGVGISGGQSVYIEIDCQNGHATIIGNTGINPADTVSDIDFDSVGRLFAYVETPGDAADQVGLLSKITGHYEELGLTGLSDLGNGLASTPYPADPLYQAGNHNVNVLDKFTGAQTTINPLSFPSGINEINGMDADPFTNIMYASLVGPGVNYLGILNVTSGNVSFLSLVPPAAPSGLEGLAVNRRYEECDPTASIPPLPSGTSCTENCLLYESNCADGIDNDENELTDCADPACQGKTCNDHNGCLTDQVCNDGACEGTPVNCDDILGNECAITHCVSSGDDSFACLEVINPAKLLYGSCTPEGNCSVPLNPNGTCPDGEVTAPCLIGRCAQVGTAIECLGGQADVIPIADGGCNQGLPCIADICIQETGACEFGVLSDIYCDDGNPCTVGDECSLGVCEPGSNVQAGGTVCVDDNQCPGSTCAGGHCLAVACSMGSACSTGDSCNGLGACGAGTATGAVLCGPTSNPCAATCEGNLCTGSAADDDQPCSTGKPCYAVDSQTCSDAGVCTGTQEPSLCGSTNDGCTEWICSVAGACVGEFYSGTVSCGAPGSGCLQTCVNGAAEGECVCP